MKKTILAAATLSVLMASGMANAAFTDADASGNWSGNLDFNGAITNTGPVWKYQIPESSVAGAKNWDIERVRGVVEGDNTMFSYPTELRILQGVMKAALQRGGAGMQPIVEFGDGADRTVWDTTALHEQDMNIGIPAKNGESTVGKLNLTLWAQAAAQSLSADGSTIAADSLYWNVPSAFQLLKSQPYYDTLYAGKAQAADWTSAPSTTFLGQETASKVTAAIVAGASAAKLVVPTSSVPDAWTATLPISITVK